MSRHSRAASAALLAFANGNPAVGSDSSCLWVVALACARGLETTPDQLMEEVDPGLSRRVRQAHDVMGEAMAPLELWAVQFSGDADALDELYEHCLAVLKSDTRRSFGAFHTPAPVADFLVAQVDGALREAGVRKGIADGASFRELGLPCAVQGALDLPAVSLLEPAAGGGALLRALVRHVVANTANSEREAAVASLFERTRAYELLPTSCVVLRWSLRLQLHQLGLDGRMVNALRVKCEDFLDSVLATDVDPSADSVLNGISVVLGNPPYNRSARHRSEPMRRWLEPYRKGLEDERNLQPLADDYIKFMRAIEVLLLRMRVAVSGLITNHTFVRGRLHRAMRTSLLDTFQHIDIVDLHGNSKVRLPGPRDENVFGIAQGVAVSVMTRVADSDDKRVTYRELRGRATEKLRRLAADSLPAPLEVTRDSSGFAPSEPIPSEYAQFLPLTSMFEYYSVGGKSGADTALVGFEPQQIVAGLEAARLRLEEGIDMRTDSATRLARRPIEQSFSTARLIPYAYRPFDHRLAYYEPELWSRPLRALYELVDGQPILLTTRIVKDAGFAHVFATREFPDVIGLSATSSVNCYAFPLSTMRVAPLQNACGREFSRQDAMAYLYGVLHSELYRSRYLGGLRQDFPRIPIMSDIALTTALVASGKRLLELHLGEGALSLRGLQFMDGGDRRLTYSPPAEAGQSKDESRGVMVEINAASHFSGIPRAAWHFRVGGYQVCRKWLLDRRKASRPLTDEDVATYLDLVARIAETCRIRSEIDDQIVRFGGFPNVLGLTQEERQVARDVK